MSVSIDDLVASLSSNHIGQEALDLAALQAQLAQTLLSHQLSNAQSAFPSAHASGGAPHTSVHIARRDPGHVQHCTTPTARTPSSSFVWPAHVAEYASHSRRSSTSSTRMRHQSQDDVLADLDDMDEEDARAVEAMIIPPDSGVAYSSTHPNSYTWSPPPSKEAHSHSMSIPNPNPPPVGSPVEMSCSPSLFTTTDPFYIQASQAAQQPHHPSAPAAASFFTLAGRPGAHSPFVMGTSAWQR
ncbi:hypothetical protein ID866_6457 [Astraeus odoratus]|nr:hypothetical protein ID866_6457 [Astraeus odoratus]